MSELDVLFDDEDVIQIERYYRNDSGVRCSHGSFSINGKQIKQAIRAEIDARIKEAMKSKKPAKDYYCPATGEAHNWRTLASGDVRCADCGKTP